MRHGQSTMELLIDALFQSLVPRWPSYGLTILWSIWFYRNIFLWQNVSAAAISILRFVDLFLQSWQQAGRVFEVVQAFSERLMVSSIAWLQPLTRFLNCNVDAA
ncbi:hypothetical protein ES332_A03G122700v1 [Gossypium tomentosum]|uniref:Uncharacterized protein n=1 Tax=Gossypium tomentosum TaxID=34277 RepID=A0A5D2R6C2_GOSTO|nr:hypothetical protein ES332_A03G122700v1 [Gossypium tomentosum]